MDNNPSFPPKTSVYSLKQENHYSVFSLKNWQNWKKNDLNVLEWYSPCVCAEQQLNTNEMSVHAIVWKSIHLPPSPTYVNCFQVCPPELWFLCLALLFSLFECVCVVPGSGLWHCAEGVSAQEWFYYQSIRWHSSPACFVRLSWLCIIALTVALRNELMHPTLSRITRPTRKMCLICSGWF